MGHFFVGMIPLLVGGAAKAAPLARQYAPQVVNQVRTLVGSSLPQYAKLAPSAQMEVINRLQKFGDRLIPSVSRSKEMIKLSQLNNEQWRNTIGKYLQDYLGGIRKR